MVSRSECEDAEVAGIGGDQEVTVNFAGCCFSSGLQTKNRFKVFKYVIWAQMSFKLERNNTFTGSGLKGRFVMGQKLLGASGLSSRFFFQSAGQRKKV